MLQEKIRLGISRCLLGHEVRYDGAGRPDRLITGLLAKYVDFVPVCPEVEAGLPVPREPMRLVGDPEDPRLITIHSGRDYTDRMRTWAAGRVRELERENLRGFIFKARSPSSGMKRVRVYAEKTGRPAGNGAGLFARALMEHFPLLPAEEDEALHEAGARENFVERLFIHWRWEQTRRLADRGALLAFHTAHKLQIMAHSVKHYREMGRLVATGRQSPVEDLFDRYGKMLMHSMKLQATPKKNINVLHHVTGYFKKVLKRKEKQELLKIIEQYRRENVPLIVPITLLNHYVRKYDQEYLAGQYYLHPHPLELMLRNHA